MAGGTKLVAGGLLSGVGEGMIRSAEEKREKALLVAKQMREDRQREEDRAFEKEQTQTAHELAMERDDRRFDREGSMLSGTLTGEGGKVYGVTRTGEAKDLGITTDPRSFKGRGSDQGFMSPTDKRLWDTVVARNTTEDTSGKKTDWNAVSSELRNQGRPDLAQIAGPAQGSQGIDVSSDEYLEAQRMADEWVDSQAGWFSLDKSDFEQYGGNREQARKAKTLEFYRQLTGSGGADQGGRGGQSPRAQGGQRADVGAPPGQGTQADPYKATTQADVDWFKASAPQGSVIEVNGQLYTK